MSKSKPLSELPPETVKRWKEKYMPPFADRPDLKEIDEEFRKAQHTREESMRKVAEARQMAERLRQEAMMGDLMPKLFPDEKQYECPKCHRKWKESQLNYLVRGKGKHKKKVPWCPHCDLQIFREGDEALKHPVIPIVDDRLQLEFKRLGLDF